MTLRTFPPVAALDALTGATTAHTITTIGHAIDGSEV